MKVKELIKMLAKTNQKKEMKELKRYLKHNRTVRTPSKVEFTSEDYVFYSDHEQ